MLQPKFEMDRDYDLIIKRSVPYLIFSPIAFREKLVNLLEALCHDYLDKNEIAFQSIYLSIKKILDEATFNDSIELKIHHFSSQQNTIDENFRRLNERLTKLEKQNDTSKKMITSVDGIKTSVDGIVKMSPRDKLEECLKSANTPLSRIEICKTTGLTDSQVSNILDRLNAYTTLKKLKQHIKIDQVKYNNRNIKVYSWIGDK